MSHRSLIYVCAFIVVAGLIGVIVTQSLGTSGAPPAPAADIPVTTPPGSLQATLEWPVAGLAVAGLVVFLLRPRRRQIARDESRVE